MQITNDINLVKYIDTRDRSTGEAAAVVLSLSEINFHRQCSEPNLHHILMCQHDGKCQTVRAATIVYRRWSGQTINTAIPIALSVGVGELGELRAQQSCGRPAFTLRRASLLRSQ